MNLNQLTRIFKKMHLKMQNVDHFVRFSIVFKRKEVCVCGGVCVCQFSSVDIREILPTEQHMKNRAFWFTYFVTALQRVQSFLH